ncbi:MAG: sigma-54-dependent transcriptional regulator [Bacteroidales bacterium]
MAMTEENKPFRVFVVEDDEWYSKLLVHNLSLIQDIVVEKYFDGKSLLDNLHKNPDVITLDYRLPDMKGDQLMKRIKSANEDTEVVVISEQEDIETAVDLLRLGAYDYLVKRSDIRDRLLNTIGNIRKHARLRRRISSLEAEVGKKYHLKHAIIGNSVPIQKVIALVGKAANSSINVTVTGETGTGKEVVAKAIHYNSARKNKPFIPVNVAAIPTELFESELFGHERGAFTGAIAQRKGKFEEASGGTIFLDEIGEMDLGFQPKLLRALQEKEITRVGSNTPVPVDCRIIVATHRNLKQEAAEGRFRQDLYYRLYGLQIDLPPLRERDKDTLILANFFISEYCRDNKLPQKTLSAEARNKLLSYSWPGNVRELKSVVELAIIMADGEEIGPDDISLSSSEILHEVLSEELTLREYDRRIVKFFLKKYDNNTKAVADKLGIGQTTIYRMMKE